MNLASKMIKFWDKHWPWSATNRMNKLRNNLEKCFTRGRRDELGLNEAKKCISNYSFAGSNGGSSNPSMPGFEKLNNPKMPAEIHYTVNKDGTVIETKIKKGKSTTRLLEKNGEYIALVERSIKK